MTYPAYLFREEISGESSDGTGGSVHQFSAGEIPTAGDFNGNTNLAFAVTANLSQRLEAIDGISSGGAYAANENIFTGISTSFTSIIEIIQNIKGGSNDWYTDVDAAGMSLQDLYDRDTIGSYGNILDVLGALEVSQNLDVKGYILNSTGNTLVQDNLDVAVDLTVDGNTTLSGNNTLTGRTTFGANGIIFDNSGSQNIKTIKLGSYNTNLSSSGWYNPTITHSLGETPDFVFVNVNLIGSASIGAGDYLNCFAASYSNTGFETMVLFSNAFYGLEVDIDWMAVVLV